MAARLLLFETPYDPAMNLALDEALTISAACREWAGVRLWRNANAVVLGYSTPINGHVDLEAARRVGAQLLRRVSGGGAVYHDLGNINYSIYIPWRLDPVRAVEDAARRVVAEALRRLGFKVRIANGSDVVVDGFKVSGNAAASRWGGTLVHGTLLIDTPSKLVSSVTPMPPKVPGNIDPVKYRVASLNEIAGERITVSRVVEALLEALEDYLGERLSPDLPYRDELEAARIIRVRHVDRDWVWGLRRLSGYKTLMENAVRALCGL